MEKRTKILLGVLAALVVLGGGAVAFMMMSAGTAMEEVNTPPAKVAKAPKEKPAEPATEMESGTEPEAKPAAPAAKPEPAKADAKPAAPATKPEPAKADAKPAAPASKPEPAKAEAKPETKAAESEKPGKPAEPASAGCVPVIKVTDNKKTTEYKTAEEFLEKSGMKDAAAKTFATKNAEGAHKAQDELKKKKASKLELDCAQKNVDLAERLVFLMTTKYPEQEAQPVYSYSSLNKRDPFMSPAEIPKVYPKVPANASPIQKVPSESLAVKAIIWNEKGYRALLFTKDDNRGYTVKVGDVVGNKNGLVDKITEKRVYIKELIPDIFGDIETRNIVLKLYKEAE